MQKIKIEELEFLHSMEFKENMFLNPFAISFTFKHFPV